MRLAPHLVLASFCAGLTLALAWRAPAGPGAVACAAAGLGAGACARARRPAGALALLCAAALTAGAVWGGVRVARTAAPDLDLPTTVRGTVVLDAPMAPDGRGGMRGRAVVERLDARGGPPVPPGTRLLLDLGGSEAPPPPGARLRVSGRLSPAAGPRSPGWWRSWLERQGIAGRLAPDSTRREGRRGGLAGLRDRWREWAGRHAGAGLTGDRAAIVRGMALGGGAGLSEDAAADFRDAGLWHLLAVSGQNVAVVAMATLSLLVALGVRRRPAVVASGALMALYCLACDGGASVGRAGIVGGLGLLAEIRSAPRERWYLMLVGLAVLLAWQPRSLGDPGLQLSFAAVAGLFLLTPPLAAWWRGWLPGRVADLAALAAAASLATAPVVVWHFGRLSLAGLVLNVAAVPLAAPIVVLALAGLAAGAVLPAAGVAAAWVAGLGAEALLSASRAAAAVPGAAVDLPVWAAPVLLALALAPLGLSALVRPGGDGGAARAPGAVAGRRGAGRGPGRGRMGARPAGSAAAVAGRARHHGARHRPGRRDPAAQPRRRRRGVRHGAAGRAGARGRRPAARGRPAAGRGGDDPRLPRPHRRRGRHPRALPGGGRAAPAGPGQRVGARRAGRDRRGRASRRPGARDPGGHGAGAGGVAGAGALAGRPAARRGRPQPVQPGRAGVGGTARCAADGRRRERCAVAARDRRGGRAEGVASRLARTRGWPRSSSACARGSR